MLDVMDIIKFQEGKRIRYKKQDDKYGFLTTPKVFADYRHFIKDDSGNQIIDTNYDYRAENPETIKYFRRITKENVEIYITTIKTPFYF